eukprot:gene4760-28256_t
MAVAMEEEKVVVSEEGSAEVMVAAVKAAGMEEEMVVAMVEGPVAGMVEAMGAAMVVGKVEDAAGTRWGMRS